MGIRGGYADGMANRAAGTSTTRTTTPARPAGPAALRRRGVSGQWVVAVLVALGLALSAVAYWYWGAQAAFWRSEGAPTLSQRGAGSAPDTELMEQEVQAVARNYADAVDRGSALDPVEQAARRLVDRYPGSADARNLLGQVLLSMHRWQEAYEQFELSLQIDARQAEVEVLAGTVSEELKRLDAAVVHYATAVSIDNRQPRYRLFLASAYYKQGLEDKAREEALEALRLDSGQHKAHALLSRLYAGRGELAMALDQIDKAIERVPLEARAEQIDYVRTKAGLLRRDNRAADALHVLTDQLSNKELRRPDVLADVATTWAMLGQPAKAAEAYEAAWGEEPAAWELPAAAAHWRLKAGGDANRQIARRLIDAVRRLRPNAPPLAELEAAWAGGGPEERQ